MFVRVQKQNKYNNKNQKIKEKKEENNKQLTKRPNKGQF